MPTIAGNLFVIVPLIAIEMVAVVVCPPAALPLGIVLGLLSIPAIEGMKGLLRWLGQETLPSFMAKARTSTRTQCAYLEADIGTFPN